MQNIKYKIKNNRSGILAGSAKFSILFIAIYFSFFIMYLPSLLFAGRGETAFQILRLEHSARHKALGGSWAALTDDLNSVTSNPAGLVLINGIEAEASHMLYFEGSYLSSLTYAQKFSRFAVGMNWKMFQAEDAERDSTGNETDTFKNIFTQTSFAAGFPVTRRDLAGLTLVSLSESLYDNRTTGLCFSFGWMHLGAGGDRIALTVKNIGAGVMYSKNKIPLPVVYTLSGGYRMGFLKFGWEARHSTEKEFAWSTGMEVTLTNITFRAGMEYNDPRADFTCGFGIPYKKLIFDYAFTPHITLGAAHSISLGGRF